MIITECMSISQACLVVIYWIAIAIAIYGIYSLLKGDSK
jgi:hypothetical protein